MTCSQQDSLGLLTLNRRLSETPNPSQSFKVSILDKSTSQSIVNKSNTDTMLRQVSLLLVVQQFFFATHASNGTNCRNQPGDPGFPSLQTLEQFNASIGGQLLNVIPTGKFCQEMGGCSDALWDNETFRQTIPGSMLMPNWEQDYLANPPSICFRDTPVCGQGLVPVLAVNATDVAHIQTGIRFASQHNLRVSVKSSGHDFLGRSTAKNSFLLWTHNFKNITFNDEFIINGVNYGSAVTVGSGVGVRTLYDAAKVQGKVVVGGGSVSISQSGGYVQGAGHAILSPLLGLAADNALAFDIVTANGELITASESSHPDLFWALRGGGAGSWGIITSTTFRTFPAFNASFTTTTLSVSSTAAVAQLISIHASHIFDWDHLNVGHYFYLTLAALPSTYDFTIQALWPNITSEAAVNASLAPFLNDAVEIAQLVGMTFAAGVVNDVIPTSLTAGTDLILGSRLIPEDVYKGNVTAIGEVYKTLLDDSGTLGILGHMVAGGQVSRNANINSAVNPKWRTAKTHIIVAAFWTDDTPASQAIAIHSNLTHQQIPVLDKLAGGFESGSYSNEADPSEPNFQVKFFGLENYPRLLEVKATYDPFDLFIVSAGVGSERWDRYGICKV